MQLINYAKQVALTIVGCLAFASPSIAATYTVINTDGKAASILSDAGHEVSEKSCTGLLARDYDGEYVVFVLSAQDLLSNAHYRCFKFLDAAARECKLLIISPVHYQLIATQAELMASAKFGGIRTGGRGVLVDLERLELC